MADLKQLQERVYQNKVAKGFNIDEVYREFCYTYGELSEACNAYMKKKEEIADVALYLLGISEILGINLEEEMLHKLDKNEKRQYIQKDGVNIRISD